MAVHMKIFFANIIDKMILDIDPDNDIEVIPPIQNVGVHRTVNSAYNCTNSKSEGGEVDHWLPDNG